MQIILLDKIAKLGSFGDQINVKAGYARNYLVPQGKALLATKKNIEYFAERRSNIENQLARTQAAAKVRLAELNKLGKVIIASKVGSKGKLFGSVGARDIANALIAAGIDIIKREVRLPNGVLRTIGNHKVNIHIHNEIFTSLDVIIIPEI